MTCCQEQRWLRHKYFISARYLARLNQRNKTSCDHICLHTQGAWLFVFQISREYSKQIWLTPSTLFSDFVATTPQGGWVTGDSKNVFLVQREIDIWYKNDISQTCGNPKF